MGDAVPQRRPPVVADRQGPLGEASNRAEDAGRLVEPCVLFEAHPERHGFQDELFCRPQQESYHSGIEFFCRPQSEPWQPQQESQPLASEPQSLASEPIQPQFLNEQVYLTGSILDEVYCKWFLQTCVGKCVSVACGLVEDMGLLVAAEIIVQGWFARCR